MKHGQRCEKCRRGKMHMQADGGLTCDYCGLTQRPSRPQTFGDLRDGDRYWSGYDRQIGARVRVKGASRQQLRNPEARSFSPNCHYEDDPTVMMHTAPGAPVFKLAGHKK